MNTHVVAPGASRTPLAARERRFRLAAAVLVAVTGLWRITTMSTWSWQADDWTLIQLAHSTPFLDYVTLVYNQHLQPGQLALYWGFTHAAPLDFTWAVVTLWLVSIAALVMWLVMLRAVFGPRMGAVAAAVPVALAPGLTPTAVWLVAALAVFTLQFFTALVIRASLPWVRDGSRRAYVLTLASFVLALVFWQKCLLIVVPVLGISLMLARDREGRPMMRRTAELLVGLGVISVAYAGIYIAASPTSTGEFDARGPGESIRFLWDALSLTVLPNLLGGPHLSSGVSSSGQPIATTSAQWIAVAVVVAITAWALSRRRNGWIPILTGAVYFVLSAGLLLASSRLGFLGLFGAYEFRYFADAVAVLALLGALLVMPAQREPRPWRPGIRPLSVPAWVGPGAFAVVLAFSLVRSAAIWDGMKDTSPRPWVDALISDATAARDASVLDASANPAVINAYLSGEYARLSNMLAPLGLPIRWDAPADRILVAAEDGHLRPGIVQPGVTSDVGPLLGCGYLVTPGTPVDVRLPNPLFAWAWGAEFRYATQRDSILRVSAGDSVVDVPLAPLSGSRQVAVEGAVDAVRLEVLPGGSPVCVDKVTVGNLLPEPPAP